MNRTTNRPRTSQMRCTRPSFSPSVPVQLTEFNRELQELPLAMAYVPIQPWGDTYSPCKALSRGTLFPQLDMPFCEVNL